ncbi:MAG: AGE family epimerase/isomerase [Sumerlaeia bacterium]
MSTAAPAQSTLARERDRVSQCLRESVIPFWMNHSLDRELGGYFNCLDRDGSVYDTKKHIWLQGRQVWMLSKLHNADPSAKDAGAFRDAATLGADFLRNRARDGQRVFFSLTREGKPHFLQRKMFSECFYVMAMAEYARATGDASARAEADELFQSILRYAKDPSLLGRPVYDNGLPATGELAVPMILLNLIEELNGADGNDFEDIAQWCVERIKLHVRHDLKMVMETVPLDGSLLDTPEGRLLNPGHAIEAGWFLMSYARKRGLADLEKMALAMIDWSFETGWDKEEGGIYYFLDRGGYSPLQLEWSMKLWWPHCEAMIAFLMAYDTTGEAAYFEKYLQVADYSFAHFDDPQHGEWFGYLDRHGRVSQRFKGGPYKGCFHVPRALWMCEGLLGGLIAKAS